MAINADQISASGASTGYNSSLVPRGQLYKTDSTAQTTTLGGSAVKGTITTTLGDSNLFEEMADNRIRYIGTRPFMAFVPSNIAGDGNGGGVGISPQHYKNGSVINSVNLPSSWVGTSNPFDQTTAYQSVTPMMPYDYIETWITRTLGANNFDTLSMITDVMWKGWMNEGDFLGAEEVPSDALQNTDDWTDTANVTSTSDGSAITVTSTGGASETSTLDVAGLTTSTKYRVAVTAYRGAQGTGQAISDITNISPGFVGEEAISSTTSDTYVFDVTTSSTSIGIAFDTGTTSGDSLIVTAVSVREYI